MLLKEGLKVSALMLAAFTVQAAPPKALAPELLDWQLYNELPAGELCEGYYLAPDLALPEAHLATDKAQLLVDAAQVNYSAKKGLLMQGDVRLRKGSLYITADQARLNATRDRAELLGDLSVRQEGLLLRGASGEYQLAAGHLQIKEAHYVIHEQRLRGSAWRLEQDAEGVVTLRDSSMTSCAPGDNAWRLVAGRLNLNQATGFGDAFNVRMEVLEVPVFYWPWLRFPIDDRRHTGLLAPTLAWSKTSGFDYQQPFYWNLAPHLDATFYPRHLAKRGFMLGTEVRYLTPRNRGEVYYARLNNDNQFDEYSRWNFAAKHQGHLNANLSYQLDFTQVSDDRYLKDLKSNSFVTADTELLQALSFNYADLGWQTRLNFQGYQKLDPNLTTPEVPYKLLNLTAGREVQNQDYYRLPQLEIRKTLSWNNTWQSHLLVDLTQFSKLFDKDLAKDYQVTQLAETKNEYYFTEWGAPDAWRLHLQPSLAAEWRWPWAYVRPEAKLKYTQYYLNPYWSETVAAEERNQVELQPSALVPVFSLDSGLYLERNTQFLNKAILQTFEPRVLLAYVPFVEQYQIPNFFDGGFVEEDAGQLFRAERTRGLDRVGDVKKVTFGLTQRLVNQNSGQEMGSLSVAKAFYLEDRRIDEGYLHPDDLSRPDNLLREEQNYENVRKTSSIGLQASFTLTPELKLNTNVLWDDHFHKTESSNTYFTFTGWTNSQVNLGHSYISNYQNLHLKGSKPAREQVKNYWSYLEQAEEQVYASLMYALNQQWRIFIKQGHDLKRSEKLDSLTGLEYNSCCWQLQLLYRDWVDNSDTSPGYLGPNSASEFTARKRDYGVFLNVVFKGLGGVGQSIPQLLEKEVQGYTGRP